MCALNRILTRLRHFERSKPGKRFCPFGDDCFYRHEEVDGVPYLLNYGVDDNAGVRAGSIVCTEKRLSPMYSVVVTTEILTTSV